MLSAFGKDRDVVTAKDIDAAIRELQWVEFASNTNRLHTLKMLHAATVNSDPSHVVGRILVASAGKTLMERELKAGRLVVGRTPDNDLQIDSKFISRHHCHIVTHADSCLIEDLNSTNGIYMQSKRVRRHNLNDGDVVQVGQHEIMYIDERSPRMRHSIEQSNTDVLEKS
jgi:pSer/pThr/pTyr-binding forkhead associated (FHA) protein